MLTGTAGFGTGRDGSFNPGAPAFYGAITGIDLLSYLNVQVSYAKYADVTFHINTEWTADPNLTQQATMGDKSFAAAQQAHLSVVGFEGNVRLPYLGHLWISPSFLSVRNGWALANAGTEVMHSLSAAGVATNYMAYTGSPSDSTGSGSMINFGFLYENTLSGVQGNAPGRVPEVTVSVFGLLADAKLNLPPASTLKQYPILAQNEIKQFKYGADVTLQVPPGSPSCFVTTRSTTRWATLDTSSPPSRRGSFSPRTSSPASASTSSILVTSTATT